MSFGIRAVKIIGNYNDSELVKSTIKLESGEIKATRESVEGIIIFKPRSLQQAKAIIEFLLTKAPEIPGGYSEPDTRASATSELKELYADGTILKLVNANIYQFREGNVLTLTPNKTISEAGWKTEFNLINNELYQYLTDPSLPIGQP